jgi:cell division protein ZipA
MSELRWILLGLGVLLVGILYLWGKKPFPSLRRSKTPSLPAEPQPATEAGASPAAVLERPIPRRRPPEKIITLRVIQRHQEQMDSEEAVLALKRAGLVHGKYGIFHSMPADGEDEPLFSVASLTEPGSFDLANLHEVDIAGLSFFMALPGVGDPVTRFDAMIEAARDLAEMFDGVLLDESGSSWSIQRERYIREEVIQYRHHLGHS